MAETGAAYEDVLARAQELGYAEADPTEDVERRRRRGEDGDPRPARVPLAGRPRRRPLRGDRVESSPTTSPTRKELGLSLKLLGVAERRGGGISVRVFPCFLYARPPAGADRGPVQRGHGRGAGDHRDHDVGPGRRRHPDRLGGARRRRLDPLRRGAGARAARESLEMVRDVSSSFYLHLEVADEPGVLARIADVLGAQRDLGQVASSSAASATTPAWSWSSTSAPRTRFARRWQEIAELDFMRARAARDPRDRGGVRLSMPQPADRALSRPAPAGARRPGRHPERGLDAAGRGAGALGEGRRAGAAQARGREPDRLASRTAG